MEKLSIRGRLMLGAAVLTWAAVGLPYWLLGWSRVLDPAAGPLMTGRLILWAVAHVGFLAALLAGHRIGRADGPRWARILLLALQAACALAATAAFGDSLQAALLVVVATQTVMLFGLVRALGWIGVQSAVFTLLLARHAEVRTALAIAAAFVGFQLFALMAVAMAEREAAARQELVRTNAELEAARELLAESSRAAERLRIARELHDGLGHHLTALSLQLEVAGHLADDGGVGSGGETGVGVGEPVARAREIAARILDDLRRSVRTLRDETPLDLPAALARLAEGIPRPAIHLAAPRRLRIDDPVRANALLRSVQELVTNTVRHSEAENLWLEVRAEDGWVEVAARDDGDGAAALVAGSGLAGMRERIEGLGGTLRVDPGPGEGFRSRLRLPLEVAATADGDGGSSRAADEDHARGTAVPVSRPRREAGG